MGLCVPKNIPMKQAAVYASYDLEHVKLKDLGAYGNEKGSMKKVYSSLHRAVKGDIEGKNIKERNKSLALAPNQ